MSPKVTPNIAKHRKFAKGCPEHISFFVDVSSCFYQKKFKNFFLSEIKFCQKLSFFTLSEF